jgi:hypothetical protein
MIPDAFRCSTFALDLYRATGAGEPGTSSHLATCERCRAYLASLDVLDASRPPLTTTHAASARARRSGARMRWMMPAGASLAVAAGALVYLAGRARTDGAYVGVKGMPSVELLVHRDAETFVWNGSAPIRAGDALAFRVACEDLAHVAVASPAGNGAVWARLKDADCPVGPSATLPFSLLVDSEGQIERFVVVVSKKVLDDDALRSAAAAGSRTADVWAVRFELSKAAGDPR